jgi:TRAP-type C4-dicarboxylate transport system substrate-binding protein
MTTLRSLVPCLLTLSLAAGAVQAADKTVVKLATLAPDGSAWHKQLEVLANDWKQATEGRVTVRLYPGGVAGDDPDLVRKIRIGQLQASALTVTGLSEIDPAISIFSIPLFFESYEEYLYVVEKMTPVFQQRFAEKGFVLLHWGHGGWLHLFSKDAVRRVEDLKRVKMFTWAGDDGMVQIWRKNGFKPVALASTDILIGLQTGMIDGLPTTPLAALSLQWFRQTPYMLGTGIAPLVGGTVISSKAWQKISEADRAVMLDAAREAEVRLTQVIPKKDRAAVEEMKKRGLTVIEIEGGAERDRWMETARTFAAEMRGSLPDEMFEMALRHRDAFRQRQADGPGD